MDEQEQEQIRKVLRDPQVARLFVEQLEQVPREAYEVTVAFEKIYVVLVPGRLRGGDGGDGRRGTSCDVESRYVLRVGRSFPLANSVRLHLLDGGFQPRVSDCRDFYRCAVGRAWEAGSTVWEAVEAVGRLDAALHGRN